jgi:hypothetical protein
MSWQPTKHDPTPWSRNWQCVLDADKRVILTAEEGGPRKGERATYFNAARTVACVNALDGIADPGVALAEVRRLLVEARDALRRSAEVYGGDAEEQVFAAEEACVAALALLGGAGR